MGRGRTGLFGYAMVRAALTIPTTLFVSLLLFLILQVLPGNAALSILSDTPHTIAMRESLEAELGLDDAWPVQYVRWLSDLLGGSSESLITGEPITAIVARQLPVTLLLTLYATLIAVAIAIPGGVVSAIHRSRIPDIVARAFTLIGRATPAHWLSLLILLGLLKVFRWSPPVIYTGFFEGFSDHIALMMWPALILAIEYGSYLSVLLRASLVATMDHRFVTAARARGVPESRVIYRYALRNSLLPPVTGLGLHFGTLLGSAIVVETIFGLPGIGLGIVDAALARDVPVILSQATALAILYQALNIVVDVLYLVIDKRITPTSRLRGEHS